MNLFEYESSFCLSLGTYSYLPIVSIWIVRIILLGTQSFSIRYLLGCQ